MDTFIKHADHAAAMGDLNTIIDKQSEVIAELNAKLKAQIDNNHANMNLLTAARIRCFELTNKLQATEADLQKKYNEASKKPLVGSPAEVNRLREALAATEACLLNQRGLLHDKEHKLAALQKKYNEDSKNKHWVAEVDRIRMRLNFEKQAHAKLQDQYDSLNKKATEQAKVLADVRGLLNCRQRGSAAMVAQISEVLA